MTATRRQGPAWPRKAGGWPVGGWYVAALCGTGVAFVCSVPLAGRIALAQAADGFVPSTLTVERVASPRRGSGRWFAHGRLPDGSEARLALGGATTPALRALPEPVPGLDAADRRARLPVMVNPALTGTWLHRQRVQPPDPALRDRALRDVAKLLAIMVGSLSLSVLAWRRLRQLDR